MMRYENIYEDPFMEKDKYGSYLMKVYMWMFIGLLLVAIGSYFSYTYGLWKNSILLVTSVLITFLTIFIMYSTNNKVIEVPSFILFNLSLGLELGYIPVYYSSVTITQGVLISSFIFMFLSLIAKSKPEYFSSSRVLYLLLGSLIGIIITEFVMMFINPSFVMNPWWDGLVALIFVGFILYDTSKLPDWYSNGYSEIDCAVNFILDFVNLLIRILAILGKKEE